MTQPPPPPRSGDQREDQAAIAGAAVGALFAATEAALLAELADVTRKAVTGALLPAVAARRLRQTVSAILAQAQEKLRALLARSAEAVAASAADVIRADMAHLPAAAVERMIQNVTQGRPGGMPELARSLENAEATAAQAVQDAFTRALSDPGFPALNALSPFRAADDIYGRTVREAMRYRTGMGEAVRGLEGAERAKQSLSRLQVAQKVLDDLSARGITGFTDSAGRNWDLASYAEMATRTASSRLHLQTQLAAMGPSGMDLVIVDNPSRHAPCPKCRPWEGKVLSLSGRSAGDSTITDAYGQQRTERIAGTVAEATAMGLLHPSCRHSLIPWTPGAAFLPTAGGQERGYVEHGLSVSSPLPIGTPQDYKDEQKLRAHERAVRAARRGALTAITPQAKRDARRDVAHAVTRLEDHVRATGAVRQPRRERIGAAR